MGVFVIMKVYISHACLVYVEQSTLDLWIWNYRQFFITYHVGSLNQTQVHRKSNQCFTSELSFQSLQKASIEDFFNEDATSSLYKLNTTPFPTTIRFNTTPFATTVRLNTTPFFLPQSGSINPLASHTHQEPMLLLLNLESFLSLCHVADLGPSFILSWF